MYRQRSSQSSMKERSYDQPDSGTMTGSRMMSLDRMQRNAPRMCLYCIILYYIILYYIILYYIAYGLDRMHPEVVSVCGCVGHEREGGGGGGLGK